MTAPLNMGEKGSIRVDLFETCVRPVYPETSKRLTFPGRLALPLAHAQPLLPITGQVISIGILISCLKMVRPDITSHQKYLKSIP